MTNKYTPADRSRPSLDPELARVQHVYATRDARIDPTRYTPFDPAHHLLHYSRQRAFLDLLLQKGYQSLRGLRILDIGCGAASTLLECLDYGAEPSHLHGTDLLRDRLQRGREKNTSLRLVASDVRQLPYRSGTFDIVTQYTVFSSIVDESHRKAVAQEMLRVLKPTGLAFFYDFWVNNPANRDVKGVPLRTVRRLFPGCRITAKRIVLAPPIARRLARVSPPLAMLCESVPWFCTHLMAAIEPEGGNAGAPLCE